MPAHNSDLPQKMSKMKIKSDIKLPVEGTVIRRNGNRYTVLIKSSPDTKLVYFNRDKCGISVLDIITIYSIVDDEVSVFKEHERHPSSIEFVGITEIVSPSLVKVVGPRCPLPVLARLPSHNEPKLHNLLAAHVGKGLTGCKVILTEEEDYCTREEDDEPSSENCITTDMCYFVGVRAISEEERVRIHTPGVIQNIAEKANQYIRDVYIVLERMNEHLEREKSKLFTVQKFLTLPNPYDIGIKQRTIAVALDKEETKRCLRSKGDSPWKTGEELIISHIKLRTNTQSHSISVDISKIELSPQGANVYTHVSMHSMGILGLINRTNTDFGDEPFNIGPNTNDHCSIANVIEKNFQHFLKNKAMFSMWAGKMSKASLLNDIDVSTEPFDVQGRPLDKLQLIAFRNALVSPGFTTVSAPPGSGKTLLISGILKESHRLTPDVRFCVSSKTNVSVANAIETTHENYPELKVCREFSLYYSRRHKMSEIAMRLSLREMCQEPLNYVGDTIELHTAMTAKRRAARHLKKAQTLHEGLVSIEERRQADTQIRSAFLEALKPVGMGATTSLMTRSVRRGITRLIIDEAAMMSPSHALALYCCMPDLRQATLLGDSRQLKPFCLLNEESFGYALLTRGELTRLDEFDTTNRQRLNTVYRCHPSIVKHILRPLYDNDLRAGVSAQQRNLADQRNMFAAKDGSPFLFVHLDESDGTLQFNKEEIEVASLLLSHLIRTNKIPTSDIAVICHHKVQQNRLNSALRSKCIDIDVQTIDSFQGKEAKVVLVLTTKTAHNLKTARQTLSFVSEVHRETVAVSRAQHMMYLLGDWKGLMETEFWGQYRPMIRETGAMVNSKFEDISPDFGFMESKSA